MTDQTLAQLVRAKYPGAYDDLSDQQLEDAVRAKFPGVYDDLPRTNAQPPVESAPSQTTTPKHPMAVLGDAVVETGKGVLKGAGQTASMLMRGAATMFPGVNYSAADAARVERRLEPTNTAQSIGRGIEKTAEMLVPAGRVAAATRGASLAMRSGAQAATGAAVEAAQGGSAEDVLSSALLMGATPAVSDVISAVGKGITHHLPEKLYAQIFKLAKDDLELAYRTQARGKPLNPTLAREAIDNGLKGSSKNMAVYSVRKLDALEDQLQKVAAKKVMVLPDKPKYVAALREIEERFGSGFFSERAQQAADLRTAIEKMPGPSARATDMLALRRFLDKMRTSSSFRLDPNLAPKQEELKVAADRLRAKLHSSPDMSPLIDKERVFIEALDAIVDDAVRRGNKQLLNLTDVILGGGGLASGGPLGATVGVGAVRGFQQPFTLTNLGKFLDSLGKGIPAGTAETATRATAAAGSKALAVPSGKQ